MYCRVCGTKVTEEMTHCPYPRCRRPLDPIDKMSPPKKDRYAASILAILLGGLGIHKFYLGEIGWGLVYLLFTWTYIPMIVGIIEGIVFLVNPQYFNKKYGFR